MSKNKLTKIILPSLFFTIAIIGWIIINRTPDDEAGEIIIASLSIQIPCSGEFDIQPLEDLQNNQPSLLADPPCGTLKESDGTKGTTIVIQGKGFSPNTETEILWEDHMGNEFRQRQDGEYVIVTTDKNGEFQTVITMPFRLIPPSQTADSYEWLLEARQGKPREEIPTIDTDIVAEHAKISLAGWFFGTIVGVSLGYGSFTLLKAAISAKPSVYEFIVFLPWRTLLMFLLTLTLYPIVFVIIFGFGARTGTTSIGTSIFLLTTTFTVLVLLEHYYPTSLTSKFISLARTLATMSVMMVYFVGIYGGGGMGFVTTMHLHFLEYNIGIKYFVLMGLLTHITTPLSITIQADIVQYVLHF